METKELKAFVDDLRIQWKDLWQNRIDDKVRAEGIAKQDYLGLFVDRGTVIRTQKELEDYLVKSLRIEPSAIGELNAEKLDQIARSYRSRKVRLLCTLISKMHRRT